MLITLLPTDKGCRDMNRLKQNGVALIVALVFLVAITLLVVTSMRTSTIQERMTANMTERNMSYQLVEATLSFVQRNVDNVNPLTLCNVAVGYYCQPVPGNLDRWADPAVTWGNGPTHPGVGQGEFVAEYMGQWVDTATPSCAVAGQSNVDEDCLRDTWRITARTTDADGAGVMLQAVFRLP